MNDGPKPNFATWDHTLLVELTHDIWDDNIRLREACEQVRLTNKDLSEELRKFIRLIPPT